MVYICSPYRGNVKVNIDNARKYSRFAVLHDTIPITPHLLYPQFMDDNIEDERTLAQHYNYVLLGNCSELWVFGDKISSGMESELDVAIKRRMKIRYFDEKCCEVKRVPSTK